MRSKWKGIYIHVILYKFVNTKFKNFGSNWLNQKINLRSSIYIKKLLRRSILVHNGISLINFKIYNPNYVGLKIGQLTYNRLLPPHSLINNERIKFNRIILRQRGKVKKRPKRSRWKNIKNIIE